MPDAVDAGSSSLTVDQDRKRQWLAGPDFFDEGRGEGVEGLDRDGFLAFRVARWRESQTITISGVLLIKLCQLGQAAIDAGSHHTAQKSSTTHFAAKVGQFHVLGHSADVGDRQLRWLFP